jgi:predicted XRE-type DNA-binding protein
VSDEPRFTVGSGNVFADLGLPDPDTRLAKAELARSISAIIRERGLTQREASELLGIDQPKVSAITRGRLGDFSLERLLTLVGRLGMDIDITVSPMLEPTRSPRMVVRRAGESIAPSDSGHPDRVAFKFK